MPRGSYRVSIAAPGPVFPFHKLTLLRGKSLVLLHESAPHSVLLVAAASRRIAASRLAIAKLLRGPLRSRNAIPAKGIRARRMIAATSRVRRPRLNRELYERKLPRRTVDVVLD